MARLRVIDSSDEDDDSFPDLETLLQQPQKPTLRGASKIQERTASRDKGENVGKEQEEESAKEPAKAPATVRRRKLGQISDNSLLRGWTAQSTKDDPDIGSGVEKRKPRTRRPRVSLMSRTTVSTPVAASKGQAGGYGSEQEDVTITEEISLAEDVFESAESEGSTFEDDLDDFIVDNDDEDESVEEIWPSNALKKPGLRLKDRKPSQPKAGTTAASNGRDRGGEVMRSSSRTESTSRNQEEPVNKAKVPRGAAEKDLADIFSALKLNEPHLPAQSGTSTKQSAQDETPPSTPPKTKPGLVSPKKLSRIPMTPHRPSSDIFWQQDFVDDWNDEHSPRKQLFPDPAKASPVKPAPAPKMKPVSAREAKKAFEQKKHDMAAVFLRELDETITDGQLSQLAASTGGIKLIWSNKLNTTAGRANWKREFSRSTGPNAAPSKHHASIELAEKVIDDEHRLLNVVAHEFCHLANFMISGITKNPHGKEFKVWASRTSRAFADRGVEVTTKHSYDIDFKYVWQCEGCRMEYKRHSKSVHPERHRCGRCHGVLLQIKPVPRGAGTGTGGSGEKKPSEWQVFMKEEMKKVRVENPGSPQKDIMKMVANKWSQRPGKPATPVLKPLSEVEGLSVGGK